MKLRYLSNHVSMIAGVAIAISAAGVFAADDNAMDECRRHLEVIGRALQKYEQENQQLPGQLSDLVPKYIADPAVLHCSADPTPGSPGRDYAHKDPRRPVSYAYEFSGDISNGLPTPQGKFPKADIGDSWGTFRLVSMHQRTFFGDQVPLVRCFHHKPIDSENETVLNFSFGGKIYTSGVAWEDHPETVELALELMSRDLDLDVPAFREKRDLGRFQEYIYGWEHDPRIKFLHDPLVEVAQKLEAYSAKVPEEKERAFPKQVAARIWIAAGEYPQALRLVENNDLAAEAYEGLGQYDRSLAIWQKLRDEKDAKRYYARRISAAYEKLGQKEKAAEWHLQAEPGAALVGKPAPLFSVKTPEGTEIKLADVLAGKKAVLVNFWFIGCRPCQAEFPVLQKLYEENRGKGFDVVAINYGDAAETIAKFLKEKKYTVPVGVGGKDEAFPGNAYKADSFPTNFLVDGSGKIVWREVGYDEAKLRAAVAKVLQGLPP